MREQVKNIFKRVLDIQHVPDDISQQNCTAWDSLKHLNLIVEIEEEFDISFEPEDIVEMKSLHVILNKIQNRK
ncbi:MAG: acyl carrier protein [Tannerella sp.]|jgi:acyl carrier protein|nr:acyl carrier protein [Tannerella sp.]